MPISDYTPSLAEVGALVRARTVDSGSNEWGTFTADTRPTNVQVESIIDSVASDCYTMFGDDIPDAPTDNKNALRDSAKRCVAYGAAALVELSHFPEQVATGRSPYKMYDERYQQALKRVSKTISEIEAGDVPGADSNSPTALSDGMPINEGGVVGWGTVW